MFRALNKIKSCSSRLELGWVAKYKYPMFNNIFLLFVFLSFSKAILRTAELPSLCNAVSSIYQLFVPHFAMVVFMCIYLHYPVNKLRDTSFEFLSIPSTVGLSKHLITA